jgi:threonylcarbamoyladenosine tRNA methylthiotransferase MtaB
MQKFKIITLGCKVNQAESAGIARQLQDRAAEAAVGEDPVDMYIINTCTVTAKASMQSRQAVRQALRAHPDARIVVTGCYAQTAPQEIRDIPGVELVLGNDGKHRIAEILSNRPADARKMIDGMPAGTDNPWPLSPVRDDRARPLLKIQDGCNARCSYCIVPLARGTSRSLPQENVLRCIRRLGDAGYPEVVLTGIHLGHYGLDLMPPSDLLTLLKRIRQQELVQRVRLSSIEPLELTDELIAFAADSRNETTAICPHFHVPLQSGDNEILRRMRRPYTREIFRDRVLGIRRHFPDASIGVDVLVGFPGETAAAFDSTCSLLKQLPVTYLHVFPFSPRKGTPADRMPDPVPADVLKARCRRLRAIGSKKKTDFYNRFSAKILEVVAETVADAENGLIKGTSANYIPVMFKGRAEQLRSIVSVRVERVDPPGVLFGTIVS